RSVYHGAARPERLPPFPTRRSSDLGRAARAWRTWVWAWHARVGAAGYRLAFLALRAWWVLVCLRSSGVRCVIRHGGDILLVRHRSEEHTSELLSQSNLVCRLLLEKK